MYALAQEVTEHITATHLLTILEATQLFLTTLDSLNTLGHTLGEEMFNLKYPNPLGQMAFNP